jgi:hypothetical protein
MGRERSNASNKGWVILAGVVTSGVVMLGFWLLVQLVDLVGSDCDLGDSVVQPRKMKCYRTASVPTRRTMPTAGEGNYPSFDC